MKTPPRYKNANWNDIPSEIKETVEWIQETKFDEPETEEQKTELDKSYKKDFQEDRPQKYLGLFLKGPVGCGKTHIIYAIKNHFEEQKRGIFVWNVTELLSVIKSDFNKKEDKKLPIDEFNNETSKENKRFLILDDIGAEKPTDFVIEQLYLIVNERYNNLLPTIFTSNYSLGELAERIGERTVSRIAEMCKIIELNGNDRRLKV